MHQVIVKFFNGEEKRGEIFNFNPNFPVFYLQVKNATGSIEGQPIKIDLVEQIFFLKKTSNDEPLVHKETIDQSIYAGALPYKLVVELKDGQIIDGSTNKYHPKDKGFFVVSLNPVDKSDRIYINAKAVKNVDCKRLLGKKLVEQQKITVEEVEESFRQQKKDREQKIEEKKERVFPQPGELFTVERKEEKSERPAGEIKEIKIKPLGEIILEAGYITPKQLEVAVSEQKKQKDRKLGQVLVDLKYVEPTDICVALASQYHLPWVDLSGINIPKEIATALPEELARKFGIIPVGKREDMLVVATSQPPTPLAGMEISKHTPLIVELVIAYDGYIQSAIDRYFPQKE